MWSLLLVGKQEGSERLPGSPAWGPHVATNTLLSNATGELHVGLANGYAGSLSVRYRQTIRAIRCPSTVDLGHVLSLLVVS